MGPIQVHAAKKDKDGAGKHGGREERSNWLSDHLIATIEDAWYEAAKCEEGHYAENCGGKCMVEEDKEEGDHREVAEEQRAEAPSLS